MDADPESAAGRCLHDFDQILFVLVLVVSRLACMHMCVYTHTCTCVSMYLCIYLSIYLSICIYLYTYLLMYTTSHCFAKL